MSTIKRTRGDTYPMTATLKVNGVVVDLTGSAVTFGYIKDGDTASKTIGGVISDAINGVVQFTPTAEDFTIAGTFKYDIQRVTGTVKTTHLKGQLILEDDVTKS